MIFFRHRSTKRSSSSSRWFYTLALLFTLLAIIPFPLAQPAYAQTPHLILFWDGGAAPTGWTCISDDAGEPFYHIFPRGSDTYGTQGGNSTHTHSAYNLVIKPVPYYVFPGAKTVFGYDEPAVEHTHDVSSTDLSQESNFPPYRSLKLIRYDGGIPTELPAGVIAPFLHGVPSGWTRQAAQDNQYILGDTSVATGGSEAHSHHGTITTSYAGGDTNSITPDVWPIARHQHRHDITLSVDDIFWASNCPPYTTVILAKADTSIAALPAGMLGLFDGSPPTPWVMQSNQGGMFYHHLLQGDTTSGKNGGSETHGHAPIDWSQLKQTGWGSNGTVSEIGYTKMMSFVAHKHYFGVSFNEVNSLPPYTDVVIASFVPSPPTVVTKQIAPIQEEAARIWGTVQSINDTSIIERGFEWYADGGTPWTSGWTETGSFGADDFYYDEINLVAGTLYHCRAKAKNEMFDVFSYGDGIEFLTLPWPPDDFSLMPGDEKIYLSWTKGDGSIRTMVRRSTTSQPLTPTDGDLVYFDTGTNYLDTGLTNGITYYYSAWGEASKGGFQQYSEFYDVRWGAPGDAPVVITDNATAISGTQATLNAHITDTAGPPVFERGFEWDTQSGPPYANNWTETGSYGVGPFSYDLSGLNKGTTYYFRATARHNEFLWGWGDELKFITPPDPPSNFIATGGDEQVELTWTKGEGAQSTLIVRSTTGYPQNPDDGDFVYNGPDSQYTETNLPACITYYYSAWSLAYGGGLTAFSDAKATAESPAYGTPGVQTEDATAIGGNTATLNGDITSICDSSIAERGFDWGTHSGEPYASSWSETGTLGTGAFSHDLNGISQKTRYFYRAKAKNNALDIWSYGEEKSFVTEDITPSVATEDARDITTTSGTLMGQVVDMGRATTVFVSFDWGIDPDNLNNETPLQSLSSPLEFSANISNLDPYTFYWYRPKADGGVYGIGYGAIHNFRTHRAPPSVSTFDATDVTTTSADLNGTLHYIGSAGTADVSFQYSTTSGVYSNETTPQTMSSPGDFQANLPGLTPATTYYYRAKAHSDHGTGYGTEHVFTTGSTPPSVTTGDAIHMTTNSALLNGNLTATGTASTVNVSFQYGTSQGGPYTGSTTPHPMTATGVFQANLTGLTPLTTYYFIAKADGGLSGTAYGDEKSFRTGMFPPAVLTMAATDTTDTASVLNGNLYNLGSANTVNVSFEYGNTHLGPYPNSTPLQSMAAAGPFQANLSSLTPGTTYYFRAKGDGGEYGVAHGTEMSFTTSTLPPEVTTNAADNIASDSARLNGNLDALGDAASVNVFFRYGTTSGGPYTDSTPPQAMSGTGPFPAVINTLQANTTYYFIAEADGGIYGTAYGTELSFTTSKVPPSVETDDATDVAPTTATLRGQLTSMGTAPAVNVWFQYGTTSGGPYPDSTPLQTRSTAGYFHADITGLAPLTTYYFIAMADGGEHGSDQGDELSFTTTCTPPSVFTGSATDITPFSASLSGVLSSLGTAPSADVSFQWGTSSGVYRHETTPQPMNAPGGFQVDLSGLASGITYYYRAKADGGVHGIGYGVEHSFTTATQPPSVTTNAVSHKTTDSATLNGTLDALGTAATVNVSFVYGTQQGGPYSDSTPPQAMTATGNFQAPIAGLTPFTTYYYRAKADGGICGTAYGDETSFTTNHLPPVVITEGASDVMTNAAILNGDLILLGTAPNVNVSFEWGTTSGGPYPNSTPLQGMTEPDIFHAHLGSLRSDTTYYFRCKGDGGIQGTSYGSENVFTTGTVSPSVTTGEATDIRIDSATLNGELNSPGSSAAVNVSFEYGTRRGGPYPDSTPQQAMTGPGAFQAELGDLSTSTTYYFRAMAVGDSTVYGTEQSFRTVTPFSNTSRQPRSSPSPPQPLPPNMTIQYLSINPGQVSVNQPVTIVTNVVNTGDEADSYAAVLRINGKVEQTRTVSVGPRATQPLKFTVKMSQPGTYTATIGNQKANFVVTGPENRPTAGTAAGILFVVVIAVIAALILLLVFISRNRFHKS